MKSIPMEFLIATFLIGFILPLYPQKFLKRDDASEMKNLNDTDKKIRFAMISHTFLLDIIYRLRKTIIKIEGWLPFSSELHVYPNSIKAWYKVQSVAPRIFYDAAIPSKRRIEITSIHNFGKEKARIIILLRKEVCLRIW